MYGMMRSVLALCLLAGTAAAGEWPSWLSVDKNGILTVEKTPFEIIHFGPGFAQTSQKKLSNVKMTRDDKAVVSEAKFLTGQLDTRVERVGDNAFRYTAELKSGTPIPTLGLAIEFVVPPSVREVTFDGKKIELPERFDAAKWVLVNKVRGKELALTLAGGSRLVVTGDLEVRIQDNRQFNNPSFAARFYFQPSTGDITSSKFAADFRLERLASQAIDLASAATMGFVDDVAGDGKGGWTDQGPDNDLRMMKPGVFDIGGMNFQILDPGKNNGKSAIVLGRGLPTEAAVRVAAPGNQLYLLHASAWTKGETIGQLVATYPDGSTETLKVDNARDVGNWWNPSHYRNAVMVWNAENRSNYVGLYFSQFTLRRPDPVGVAFKVADPGVMWMVVAANLGDRPFPIAGMNKTTYITEGKEWFRYDDTLEVIAGSPMDFSDMLDAPAGKYGRVIPAADGHFTFEKAADKRIKFVGINICMEANFPTHEDADRIADRFARMGYNAVRFHHQDGYMLKKKPESSLDFDPEKVDRIEYFFAALKKRGLYITTDVFVNRRTYKGDNIPEAVYSGAHAETKALLPISPTARRVWEAFAREWLTHKNPYTNLTWAEDPALYLISFTNENNIYQYWSQFSEIAERYRTAFPAWMAKNHAGERVGTADVANRRFKEFIYDLQHQSILEQAKFLRDTLKVQALRTDVNMHNFVPLALIRNDLDVVDSHKYHDHPSFPVNAWRLPNQYRQRSAISTLGNEVPELLFGARLFGKPFGISEYKFCPPNRFRAEGGPLIGAYAALQGWDGLYHFDFSHSLKVATTVTPIGTFDISSDPLAQLADRLTLFLFRRGDVKTADPAFAYQIDPKFWDGKEDDVYPVAFSRLGLIARVGNVVGNKAPAGVKLVNRKTADGNAPLPDAAVEKLRARMAKDNIAESATGELKLDANARTLAIATPRTECVTVASGDLKADRLAVAGAKAPQSLSASSLTDAPLAAAPSILVFHMTNTANQKMKFAHDDFRLLEHWGELPRLVYRDPVTVTLKLEGAAKPKVRALSLPGAVMGEVPSKFENGVLTFTADPGAFKGGVMVYHVTR